MRVICRLAVAGAPIAPATLVPAIAAEAFAKALGLTIPQSLRRRADEVIR